MKTIMFNPSVQTMLYRMRCVRFARNSNPIGYFIVSSVSLCICTLRADKKLPSSNAAA